MCNKMHSLHPTYIYLDFISNIQSISELVNIQCGPFNR